MNDIDDILRNMERGEVNSDAWWADGVKLERAFYKDIQKKNPNLSHHEIGRRANERVARHQHRIRGNSKQRSTFKKMEQKTREEIERDY